MNTYTYVSPNATHNVFAQSIVEADKKLQQQYNIAATKCTCITGASIVLFNPARITVHQLSPERVVKTGNDGYRLELPTRWYNTTNVFVDVGWVKSLFNVNHNGVLCHAPDLQQLMRKHNKLNLRWKVGNQYFMIPEPDTIMLE